MVNGNHDAGFQSMDLIAQGFQLRRIFVVTGKQNDHPRVRMQNATTIVIIQRATLDIQNDGSQHGAFPFLEIQNKERL
jgi:hypothetical protein